MAGIHQLLQTLVSLDEGMRLKKQSG
jgi:hypothetical protein